MNALILVDLQNDFCPGGALAVRDGDAVIPVANQVHHQFEVVVATQDWHPADHGSFAANNPGTSPGQVVELHGLEQVLWPVHCVQHTPGAAFADSLNMTRVERVFQKGTDAKVDSYSGFYDNGRRHTTGLTAYLRSKGVAAVYVMGLATDYCVKFTALDAVADGFAVHLIEDGCRGVELAPGDVDKAVQQMRDAGVVVGKSSQLG